MKGDHEAGAPEERRTGTDDRARYEQPYGSLVELNTERTILDSIGDEYIRDIASEYLAVLGTSLAVYEKNGDYALRIVSSEWCRFLDERSRQLCETDDNREALTCGKWHCHVSCWETSKAAIEAGQPAELECHGGIRIYAVPIRAGNEIVGAINIGYGNPSTDPHGIENLADRYAVSTNVLLERARRYETHPSWIIDIAKSNLRRTARWMGEIILRRQAEERLRTSHEQLRSLGNYLDTIILNLPVGTAILEGEDLKYFRINRTLAEINGPSVEDHLGRPLAEVLPDAAPILVPRFRQVLKSGKPSAPFDVRLRLPGEPGRLRDFVDRCFPIFVGGEERPRAVGVVMVEVTERKLAEEKLKKAHDELERRVEERTTELARASARLKERVAEKEHVELLLRNSERCLRDQFVELEHLYRTAPVGLCLLDRDLRYVRINERLAAVNGPPVAEHLGRTISEVLPQLAETVVPMYRHVLETGQPILDREVTGAPPTQPGEVGYWLVSCYPLKPPQGAAWGISIVVQDITAQKRAEEDARRHLEELAHLSRVSTMGEMVTGIAHELSQPLGAIANLASVAQHKLGVGASPEAEELSMLFKDLLEQALRAGEIVRHLRAFITKAPARRATTDVNELISDVIKLVKPELNLNSIHLERKLAESLPQVSADGIQIQQVIINLVRNALEAMAPMAADTRRLTIATSAPCSGTVEIAVIDSGIGIRAENARRLFDTFFTTKANGMGLGLGISRSIIADHGGRLWAEANPDGGAAFRFTLPAAKSDGDARE
jgi:PAS domain S-box-containing protein